MSSSVSPKSYQSGAWEQQVCPSPPLPLAAPERHSVTLSSRDAVPTEQGAAPANTLEPPDYYAWYVIDLQIQLSMDFHIWQKHTLQFNPNELKLSVKLRGTRFFKINMPLIRKYYKMMHVHRSVDSVTPFYDSSCGTLVEGTNMM